MLTRNLLFAFLLAGLTLLGACGGGGGGDGLPTVPACCNVDSPTCGCFSHAGAWDPALGFIQDVARETLGTTASCVGDGGKPHYQMRYGFNDPDTAEVGSCLLAALTPYLDPDFLMRDAWCSEAISYWHREAAIPYATGFRNTGWFLDWQLPNTGALKLWYETEEASGGRGRWIEWQSLDYEDYQPGVTAPVPGSYILLRRYDDTVTPPAWRGHSHSIMIDELTVYRTLEGHVQRMEATILEGNNGAQVVDTRVVNDLLDVTPQGDLFEPGTRKIVGFGVDLDPSGDPIYDASRLHTVTVGSGRVIKDPPPDPSDLIWESWYGPLVEPLAAFAKTIREQQGPLVVSSTQMLDFSGIPDGNGHRWTFPADVDQVAPKGFEIRIDLHGVHPLPLKRLLFLWAGTEIPQGFRVLYAGADQEYVEALVPAIGEGAMKFRQDGVAVLPVPVQIGTEGAGVRYLRLLFPAGSLLGVSALEELCFVHDGGPLVDADEIP